MARTWREIRREIDVDEALVKEYGHLMEAEVALDDVRRRRGLSQAQVAERLEVTQPNISRIETGRDLYLSTLARYISALGGDLEVRAVFPDETLDLLRNPKSPGRSAPDRPLG